MNFRSRLLADIAIMPRLIDDTSYFAFIGRITENKPVFPAILYQPLLYSGFLLRRIQILIIDIDNVYCETQLMFAGAWNSN